MATANVKKQSIKVVDGVLICSYPSIGKEFRRKLSEYPAETHAAANEHGFVQKFGDAKSGKSPSEKYAEVLLIDECLMNGDWNRTRGSNVTEIVEAVAAIMKISADKVEAAVKAKPEKLAEWRANPQVKAHVAAERAKRAKEAAKAVKSDTITLE